MSNKTDSSSVTGFGEPRKPEMNDDTTSGGSVYETDEFSSLGEVLTVVDNRRIFAPCSFSGVSDRTAVMLACIASEGEEGG